MNIVDLAKCIQTAMLNHLKNNPDAKQEEVEKEGLRTAMIVSKGTLNPVWVEMMVRAETSIYAGSKLVKTGRLRC